MIAREYIDWFEKNYDAASPHFDLAEDSHDFDGTKRRRRLITVDGEIVGVAALAVLYPPDVVRIHYVEAQPRGNGHGTQILLKLCEKADELRVTLQLEAVPKYPKEMTRENLVRFYEEHDFVCSRSRGAPGVVVPFTTMVREPKASR